MSDDLKEIFQEPRLLGTPVKRAAYSDRTAWFMSAMSELAYFRFEDVDLVSELVEELSGEKRAAVIRNKLNAFFQAAKVGEGDKTDILADILKSVDFELINTYNIGGTQGFLAKRTGRDAPMMVLALRGTEASFGNIHETVEDVKADLKASLVTLEGGAKIHKGFYDAFQLIKDPVEKDLKKHKNIPLYITGHSLGGALAIVATRFLGSDSLGACYTFGSPRIGNEVLARPIKTPIYRVVNAADGVPRMPPAMMIYLLIVVTRWFPGTKWLVNFLRKIKGYVHYGDMRFLIHVEAEGQALIEQIDLLCNPSFFERVMKVFGRLMSTRFKAAAEDHSISLYRTKLCAYALKRNQE
jgi:triacylglycerol lipase